MDNRPSILQEVGFDFKPDSKKVWKLEIPTVEIPIEDLLWNFDYPWWEKEGTDDWNLTPWEVVRSPKEQPTHYAKVLAADTHYPIDIMENKGRYGILDGMHRLVKLYLEGKKKVKVRIISTSYIPEII